MTYAQYKKITENRTKSIGIQMDKPVAEWGNKTLSQIGVDEKNPVQENYYPDNTAGDTGYVYFYLNSQTAVRHQLLCNIITLRVM